MIKLVGVCFTFLLFTFSGCNDNNSDILQFSFFGDTTTVYKHLGKHVKFEGYKIISDNNSNGLANPGEAITFELKYFNDGTSPIRFEHTINTSCSFVTNIIYSSGSYVTAAGSCGPSEEVSGRIQISISSTTPISTIIPFSIRIHEDGGQEWQDTFSIRVY